MPGKLGKTIQESYESVEQFLMLLALKTKLYRYHINLKFSPFYGCFSNMSLFPEIRPRIRLIPVFVPVRTFIVPVLLYCSSRSRKHYLLSDC